MCRKWVLVGVFLAVLPVLMPPAKARGAEPLKNAGGTPAPQSEAAAADPFGGGSGFSDPDALKLLRPPKVESAKPKVKTAKPKAGHAKPKPGSGTTLHGGEKAILRALKQKTSLEFQEVPLKDAVDYLSQMHRIPIRLDLAALKEAGIDESTPITCKVSGIPLRSALEIILDELQLKWAIRHDVLMVTSPAKAESDEYMYRKCYDVTDLLASSKDYDLQNPLAPLKQGASDYQASSMGPMGQFGAPGPNGMPINSRMQPASYDAVTLKETITNLVAPKTWVENGGVGEIRDYDRMLTISQTREIHTQLEEFLTDLRARRNAAPILSVELHWLWLDGKQCDRLLAGHVKSSHGLRWLVVDRKRLREIAREVPGFHGQTACLNGIGTSLAAGDRRSVIQNTIPVVADGVGYMPIISVPNVGVIAQVRPTLLPGTKTAMLDISSLITRWGASPKPAIIGAAWPASQTVTATNPTPPPPVQNPPNKAPATPPPAAAPSVTTHSTGAGSASCPMDLPVIATQQIGTMLRVPLGKPVIVGSCTFAAAGDAGLGAAKADPVEVYLIATTSIVKKAAK